ncbi:MAG TPA: TIR domain-containing protein [Pyrinomonadaceae bacterium]|nr:TIR domain-containing protein [Pyrinomonadaceae bacterium]
MTDKKIVFVAFPIEDERQRDFLKGQSLNTKCPIEFVDMSVKEPYDTDWKDRVRTRIRRSDGVIALVSKNTLSSTGEKWEISCAKDEKKKLIGVWAYTGDRTSPSELSGYSIIPWTWDGIVAFIDGL